MTENEEVRANKMGFLECTSYVVGNIIGSGIFITPTSILGYTGSVGLSLIVWIACGIISLLGSVSYIELGTSILEPGCDFAYCCFVGWHAAAFAFMWVSVLLTYPASAAVQAQTFGQYIVTGLSPLIVLDEPYHSIAEKGIGFVLLGLLTLLNWYSLDKAAARFQVIVTGAKMLAMAVIIGAGFYFLIFQGWTHNLENMMDGSKWGAGSLALATYGGLWSYAGWDILNYGTPEIHKPKRTMPLSLLSGISIVCVTYTAINVAYFVVLSKEEMLSSRAVAALFAQKVLGNFSYAIPFMVALLLIGTLNSNIFCGSRYMHAAAREGHLPPFMSCLNQLTGSPRAAVLAQTILTVAISFVDIDTLINYVTFVMWAQRAVTMAALLYLRYKKMEVDSGAIRVPITLSFVFFLLSCALVLVPTIEEFQVTLIGVAIVLSGLVFYFLFVRPPTLPVPLAKINDALTSFTCRTLVTVPDVRKKLEDVHATAEERKRLEEANAV